MILGGSERQISIETYEDKISRRLEAYQKCVNRIDDYLEYRYVRDDVAAVRTKLLGFLNDLTNDLRVGTEPKKPE
jgi:hypothetical protein